jgi:hypothetical protein
MKVDLLKGTWGCGEYLATTLLSMYGGHVLHASAAVRKLATSTNRTTMKGAAAVDAILHDPRACLDDDTLAAAGIGWLRRIGMRKRVLVALRALVLDGFVPLESEEDEVVSEIISLSHVGFVISMGATAEFVPQRAWAASPARKSVLVPSSHIMRLLIARDVF